MNYSTFEKECLTLVLVSQYLKFLSSSPVVVYSDHNLFVFIHKLKAKNQWLLRWSLMFQECSDSQTLETSFK